MHAYRDVFLHTEPSEDVVFLLQADVGKVVVALELRQFSYNVVQIAIHLSHWGVKLSKHHKQYAKYQQQRKRGQRSGGFVRVPANMLAQCYPQRRS